MIKVMVSQKWASFGQAGILVFWFFLFSWLNRSEQLFYKTGQSLLGTRLFLLSFPYLASLKPFLTPNARLHMEEE